MIGFLAATILGGIALAFRHTPAAIMWAALVIVEALSK